MRTQWLWARAGLLINLLLPLGGARADAPPPDSYVERCNLQKTCPVGQECVLCPADYRDYSQKPTVCEKNLAGLGFARQCKSWGASVWEEVWCRPVSGASDASVTITAPDAGSGRNDARFGQSTSVVVCKPGTESSDDGCAIAGAAEPRGPFQLLVACALIVLGLRFARRRR